MNHRSCFDFKRSQIGAVLEWISVIKKSQRLEGAGAGQSVPEEFPSNGIYSTRSGFSMHKVVLVICAKRLWNHTDSERAMILNCCCFLIVCLFVFMSIKL